MNNNVILLLLSFTRKNSSFFFFCSSYSTLSHSWEKSREVFISFHYHCSYCEDVVSSQCDQCRNEDSEMCTRVRMRNRCSHGLKLTYVVLWLWTSHKGHSNYSLFDQLEPFLGSQVSDRVLHLLANITLRLPVFLCQDLESIIFWRSQGNHGLCLLSEFSQGLFLGLTCFWTVFSPFLYFMKSAFPLKSGSCKI